MLLQQSAATAPGLGHGESAHGHSSEAQLPFLTLDMWYGAMSKNIQTTTQFRSSHMLSE